MIQITAEQLEQFEREGFFLLPDVFTPQEMEELAQTIEVFQTQHEERLREQGGTEGISRSREISFTPFLAEQDSQLAAFVTRPEFVEIATTLLGPDVDLYWNQAVFKGPDGEKEFPWHQDEGYTPVDPAPYLTLWLALNDATVENGCVWVKPGTHKLGRVEHTQSPIGLICYSSAEPDQGIPVPVGAGGMAVFTSRTFHKSGVNRSSGQRKAYIIQYSRSPLRNALTGDLIQNRIPLTREGAAAAMCPQQRK